MADLTPPKNPFTIRLNEWLTGKVLAAFFSQNLPGYSYRVTSSYRTPEHNREIGGAADSAHIYGLAKDIWITQAGRDLPAGEVEKLYRSKIAGMWEGFSLWEKDHIHLNLPREVTVTTGIIGLIAGGVAAWAAVRAIVESRGKK